MYDIYNERKVMQRSWHQFGIASLNQHYNRIDLRSVPTHLWSSKFQES